MAALLDWLLEVGIAMAAGWLTCQRTGLLWLAILAGIATWVSVSFVHHVVLQRISHFTLGKFAVRLQLTYPDGSRPGIVGLFLIWVATAVISALIVPALVVFSIPMLMEAAARPFEKASEGGKREHGIEEYW